MPILVLWHKLSFDEWLWRFQDYSNNALVHVIEHGYFEPSCEHFPTSVNCSFDMMYQKTPHSLHSTTCTYIEHQQYEESINRVLSLSNFQQHELLCQHEEYPTIIRVSAMGWGKDFQLASPSEFHGLQNSSCLVLLKRDIKEWKKDHQIIRFDSGNQNIENRNTETRNKQVILSISVATSDH